MKHEEDVILNEMTAKVHTLIRLIWFRKFQMKFVANIFVPISPWTLISCWQWAADAQFEVFWHFYVLISLFSLKIKFLFGLKKFESDKKKCEGTKICAGKSKNLEQNFLEQKVLNIILTLKRSF